MQSLGFVIVRGDCLCVKVYVYVEVRCAMIFYMKFAALETAVISGKLSQRLLRAISTSQKRYTTIGPLDVLDLINWYAQIG